MKDISRERVEKSVKSVAEIVNRNEAVIQDLEWACEDEEWNSDVVYQLKEAQILLGEALATLVNWFDNVNECNENECTLQSIAAQTLKMCDDIKDNKKKTDSK